ncbi:Methyltransferase [Minicystis rosea]|nr:Methyltransferase [Minicystis rosea]
MIAVAEVEQALERLFIAAEGARLRREDRKKAVEVAALLGELGRAGARGTFVDAAAGKAYVGLLAAELLGVTDLRVIEREPTRAAACRAAAEKLSTRARIDVRAGDVADASLWPASPHAVVALHACGPASDAILDAAVAAGARWLFLVPCCYGAAIPFAATASAAADRLGLPRHAEVRRRHLAALIDAERTLRLEAAGYETTVVPFVAPTVTGHNLLWRARRAGEPVRMREAAERLAQLRSLAG